MNLPKVPKPSFDLIAALVCLLGWNVFAILAVGTYPEFGWIAWALLSTVFQAFYIVMALYWLKKKTDERE